MHLYLKPFFHCLKRIKIYYIKLSYDVAHSKSNVATYIKNISISTKQAELFFDEYSEQIESSLSYNVFDLMNLFNNLVETALSSFYPEYTKYKTLVGVRRPLFIVPSTPLLKKVGLNIEGNNSVSRLKDVDKLFLDLNENQIEKCWFFKENTDLTETEKCINNLFKLNLES